MQRTRRGIKKYLAIMADVGTTNVAEDARFQHLYNGFYQVRRNAEWRAVYYGYMQSKKNAPPSMKEALAYLTASTPRHSVELSFASKLLHTIDPTIPYLTKRRLLFCGQAVTFLQIVCRWYVGGAIPSFGRRGAVARPRLCGCTRLP